MAENTKAPDKSTDMSAEDARKLIATERDARGAAFGVELEKLMRTHGCTIWAGPIFTDDGRVGAEWGIHPLDAP